LAFPGDWEPHSTYSAVDGSGFTGESMKAGFHGVPLYGDEQIITKAALSAAYEGAEIQVSFQSVEGVSGSYTLVLRLDSGAMFASTTYSHPGGTGVQTVTLVDYIPAASMPDKIRIGIKCDSNTSSHVKITNVVLCPP
jgi:hypothetical protein